MRISANGIFVTGTDTGVGKTVVASGLLCLLRKHGVDAAPMKPVQTGCAGGNKAPDLEFMLAASGLRPSNALRRLMCPYRFAPACSPHLAAARASKRISFARIIACFNELRREHDIVVVEGAGGILVPLSQHGTMLDLMTALALPVVLVARPGLGTINHTLLSAREIRRAGLELLGVVFNHARRGGPSYIEKDNFRRVARLGGCAVWSFPFIDGLTPRNVPRKFETPGIFSRMPSSDDMSICSASLWQAEGLSDHSQG